MSQPGYPDPPPALPVAVYDSHCHLDHGLDPHAPLAPETALELARDVGVAGIVQIGCDVESAVWSVGTASRVPGIVAGIGLHPNEIPRLSARGRLTESLNEIARLAGDPCVRAIGETGLDHFRTDADGWRAQEDAFRWHIDLAKRLDKALVIHDRDAHDDVVRVLLDEGAPSRVVFHCFSGGPDLATAIAEHGWYASFAGTVTFKNAEPLRDALALLPQDRLLVETDAPYLAPDPLRGRTNASYLVPYTLRRMAQVRDEELDALAAAVATTTVDVFGSFDPL